MYPRSFDYVAPATVDEAVAVLAANPDAKVMAGGQSLLSLMKLRLLSPALIVDLGRVPGLAGVRRDGDDLVVGALTTHAAAAGDAAVRQQAEALAEAAASVGDVQVRNRGTVGGSLAHADAIADEPGAVLALGAHMVARSASGSRTIAAADFFVDALTTALAPDEVLTEIRIAAAGPGEGSAYDKLGRRGGRRDYPVAGAAAWVRVAGGTVTGATVAVTGAGTKPALAPSAAEALVGTDGGPAAVVEAAARGAEDLTVIEDLYGSREYKGHLVRLYVARAMTVALDRASRGVNQ